MVAKSFEGFIENPEQDYDQYLIYFHYLMFYGYTDVLRKAITNNATIIDDSNDCMFEPECSLMTCELFLKLSDYYENEKFDRNGFKQFMTKNRPFKVDEIFIESFEKGFNSPLPEKAELVEILSKNVLEGLRLLEMLFVKYMYDKGFSTCFAKKIWDNIQALWCSKEGKKEKYVNFDKYFSISEASFGEQLEDIGSNYFGCNTKEVAATLWGSVFIYDFLKDVGLISANTHQDFLQLNNKAKSRFIVDNTGDLWIYDFVHTWTKPESIGEKEFEAEHSLFRKSYDLKHNDNEVFFMETEKELKELEEMGRMIIEANKEKAKAEKYSFYGYEDEDIEIYLGDDDDDESSDEFDDEDDDFDDDEYDDFDDEDEDEYDDFDDEDFDDDFDDDEDDYDDDEDDFDDDDED